MTYEVDTDRGDVVLVVDVVLKLRIKFCPPRFSTYSETHEQR